VQNSGTANPRHRVVTAAFLALALLILALNSPAAELEKQTLAAFNHYVEVAEQQMQSSLHADGPFLWIDFRPASSRKHYYDQLRSGQFVIKRLETYDDGQDIDIPDGMVHHWIGLAFVPHATLRSAEMVLQDYQDYSQIYSPQVRRSKILSRDGDGFKLYLQLFKDSPRMVSYNAEFNVERSRLGPTRIVSSSISTRIAQLQDATKPDGDEYPVGKDAGYLWRMNDYWRYEEKDGGVYMQVEAISLSRDVPAILSWFVKPIIRKVARQTIANLLEANRRAIEDPGKYAPNAVAAAHASDPETSSNP
jgi:hypothetical protein